MLEPGNPDLLPLSCLTLRESIKLAASLFSFTSGRREHHAQHFVDLHCIQLPLFPLEVLQSATAGSKPTQAT